MNLLFSIDHNCVDLMLNCIYSAEENGGADSYHVFVLHSDLVKEVQEKIQSPVNLLMFRRICLKGSR